MEIMVITLSIIFSLIFMFFTSTRKIDPTQVLVKSSRLSTKYYVCEGSALVLPFLHTIKPISLTPKIIELDLLEDKSLICKDGIRIQLKAQFTISVNEKSNEDVLSVAKKFDASYPVNKLETIFLDALTTVTRNLNYEQINGSYKLDDDENTGQGDLERTQCLSNFRQLVLQELGQYFDGRMEDEHNVIISGYRIDAMSIPKLDMLDNLDAYNPNDISDSKGIAKIKRILAEHEQEKERIRIELEHQRNINEIKETDSREDAKQKIAEKEDEFEIKRIVLENNSEIEKLKLENKKKVEENKLNRSFINEEAQSKLEEMKLEKEHKAKEIELAQQIAEKEIELETHRIETESKKVEKESEFEVQKMQFVNEQKVKELELEKDIAEKEIEHEYALSSFKKQKEQTSRIADEEREKEFSSKQRERKRIEAEEEEGLSQQLIQSAQQKEQLKKAEAKESKAREIEEARAEQELEKIKAQTEAQTQFSTMEAQANAEAFQLKVMAEAKKEAAENNAIAAEQEAEALKLVGNTEAEILKVKIAADNGISQQRMNAEIIKQLIPLLPQITASLMSPAEKIDSIKFLNINGLEGLSQIGNGDANTSYNSLLNTMMTVGMAAPVALSVIKMLKEDGANPMLYQDIVNTVKNIPGAEKLIEQLENKSQDNKNTE